jgi:hypothetical protein
LPTNAKTLPDVLTDFTPRSIRLVHASLLTICYTLHFIHRRRIICTFSLFIVSLCPTQDSVIPVTIIAY